MEKNQTGTQYKLKETKEMKIKILNCLVLSFFSLFSANCLFRNPETKNVQKIRLNGQDVCVTGQLSSDRESKNSLPAGFWGNYPDRGVVEIGGSGGNPYAKQKPSLRCDFEGSSLFLITFKTKIDEIESEKYFDMGVSLDCSDSSGNKKLISQAKLNRFYDLFKPTDYYYSPTKLNLETMEPLQNLFMISTDEENYQFFTIGITITFSASLRINSLKLSYSDTSYEISNVSFSTNIINYENGKVKYEGLDNCYEKNIFLEGDNNLNSIESEYGYLINSSFFNFLICDNEKFSNKTVLEFFDRNQYFREGKYADINTVFLLDATCVDDSGGFHIWHFSVAVVDKESPVVYLKDTSGNIIKTDYSELKNRDEFINKHFEVHDNYSLKPIAEIKLKDYSDIPEKALGVFQCILIAKDESNLETTLQFVLIIGDNTSPIITKKASDIFISKQKKLNEKEILSNFTAYDEIDGQLAVEIKNNSYFGNESVIGDYLFEISCHDKNYNYATDSLTIHVRDEETDEWYSNKTLFSFNYQQVPSLEEISETLIKEGILPDITYSSIEQISGDEFGDSLSLGVHLITIRYISTDEKTYDIDLTIKIMEPTNDGDNVKKSIWQIIADFFVNVWKNIVSFFTGNE